MITSLRLLSLAALLLISAANADAKSPHTLRQYFTGKASVLQNFTTDTYFLFTVLRQKSESWDYVIYNSKGEDIGNALELTRTVDVEAKHVTDQLSARGLNADEEYHLEIRDKKTGKTLDTRLLKTLPTTKASPRIAVASCSRVGFLTREWSKKTNWKRLTRLNPDIIVFLGDAVYPDNAVEAILAKKPTFEKIQQKYVRSWKKDSLYHQYRLTPFYSVWDDHDFGYNDAASDNPHREKMLDLYRSFYPLPDFDNRISRGFGGSYAFKVMGHSFILLDDRFFNVPRNKENPTTWGQDQGAWLKGHLTGGSVFLGNGYLWRQSSDKEGRNSVETVNAQELQQVTDAIKTSGTRVVLLSGDTHFTEVRSNNLFGYNTYEITSSHMHSFYSALTPPFANGHAPENKDQKFHTARSNFVIVQPDSIELNSLRVGIYPRSERPDYMSLSIGAPPVREAVRCEGLFRVAN